MSKHRIQIFSILLVSALAVWPLGLVPAQEASQKTLEPPAPAYHSSPPREPLPQTLDPLEFSNDHSVFVAYSLAAKIKPLLYQVPCYCGCGARHGHNSLLDCFTGTHGVKCHMCQKEVLFCFAEEKKHKSPDEIRKELADGNAWNLDLAREVEPLYLRLKQQTK